MRPTRTSSIEIRLDGASLIAVPAVHYQHVFADHVNRLAADPETRPDAVAVELGPAATAAALAWLRELGVGPNRDVTLPCLLGLMRVRPGTTPGKRPVGLAFATQVSSDESTWDASPHAAVDLLPLSPTDSIIEAIRCALELEVPCYGVDMEDVPRLDRDPVLIEDPLAAAHDLEHYVERNGRFGQSQRHPEVDGQRERVMAARLKRLLKRHRRVVFTGGLAHWSHLRRLLTEPGVEGVEGVEAAPELPAGSETAYSRTLVHPALAVLFIDRLPAVARAHAQARVRPSMRRRLKLRPVDPQPLLSGILRASAREYFDGGEGRSTGDGDALATFRQLLTSVSLLQQRRSPDLLTVMEVARTTSTPRFCDVLLGHLMDFPWASPQDWPDLPVVGPHRPQVGDERKRDEFFVTIRVPQSSTTNGSGPAHYTETGPFHLRAGREPADPARMALLDSWCWQDEPTATGASTANGALRIWPPCDFLIAYLAVGAARVAEDAEKDRSARVFEGSLLDGVDIKSTLRAAIRGERRPYVRGTSRKKRTLRRESDLEPAVYIFSAPGHGETGSWRLRGGSMSWHHREHVADKERLAQVIEERGDYLVEAVVFGEEVPVPFGLRKHVQTLESLHGTVYFTLANWNALLEARFLEETHYQRCPILSSLAFAQLVGSYRLRHGVELDPDDWPGTLVRLAIPYADDRVLVVAPDGYRPAPSILAEAGRRGVELVVAPHSCFPRELIQKASVQYGVTAEDKDGLRYPAELTRLLGEAPDSYSALLPRRLVDYESRCRN